MTALADVTPDKIEALERAMLEQEQVDCPVTHHFGPGVYIREVAIPAGTVVIGHHHKGPCLNMLLKGAMKIRDPDGHPRVIEAPLVFTTGPGRKVALALSDCVFQNIHATEETDLDKLEQLLIEKSETWEAHMAALGDAHRLLEGE
jgi:hypothetical protein